MAQGGQVQQGDGPHGFTLADGSDVAYLDTYIAGRMGTAHSVKRGILDAAEGRSGLPYRDVHGSNLAQGVHAGLNVLHGFDQGEIVVRGQRSRAEGGYENCLGCSLGVCHDAVGALDKRSPQTGVQEDLLNPGGVCGSLGPEVHVLLGGIGLYQNCQQLSLFAPDNLLYGAADGRGEQNLGTLFVGHHGGACLHSVALLHQQPGNQAFEAGGLYGNDVRNHGFDDFGGCNTFDGNVQTLFQIEIV